MDGLHATREIRKMEHAATGRGLTPHYICAMTANAAAEDRVDCLDAGMDEHIPKPIYPQMVRDVIERAVNHVHGGAGGGIVR